MTTATEPDNQTAAVESASDRPAQDLLSQAIAMRTEWDAINQHGERERGDESVATYLRLLSRKDEPRKGDAVDLAHAMVDMEVSPEQAVQDIEIMEQALLFQDRRAQIDEAHQLSIAARDEFHRREKEWEIEEHELYMKKETTNVHYGQCHAADYELTKLQRQRPLLFTKPGEGGLVRLVGTQLIE